LNNPAVVPRLHLSPILLALCFISPALPAESLRDLPSRNYWHYQIENDLFTLKPGDRYYTGGLQLSLLQPDKPLLAWQPALMRWMNGDENILRSAREISIGHKIFTPAATHLTTPPADDRPYAGWLYASFASHLLISGHVETVHTIELSLGMVGPSTRSAALQRSIHRTFNSDMPQGWQHQLADEPGVVLLVARKWRLPPMQLHRLKYDISPHLVLSIGNIYSYAGGGVILRLGNNLNADIGPPNIRPGFPGASAFAHTSQRPAWYLFAGHESRLVARDLFLDGNTWHAGAGVNHDGIVGDYQFGIVWLYGNLRLGLSNILRSREFKTQQQATHFGAISISLAH
jgi:lipid A 3-O-deacylase